ncbi:MAG: hypothetical protein JWQ68_2293, partial [Cryobacterium sp.]|nr:hypothetical protein [Cryobacterium sp.]
DRSHPVNKRGQIGRGQRPRENCHGASRQQHRSNDRQPHARILVRTRVSNRDYGLNVDNAHYTLRSRVAVIIRTKDRSCEQRRSVSPLASLRVVRTLTGWFRRVGRDVARHAREQRLANACGGFAVPG